MKILIVKSSNYIPSDEIEIQGKRRDIKPNLKNYYIKEERNGYFLLVRTAKIFAEIITSDNMIKNIEIKQAVLNYYGKSRISSSLFEKFQKDLMKKKVILIIDEKGFISLQSTI